MRSLEPTEALVRAASLYLPIGPTSDTQTSTEVVGHAARTPEPAPAPLEVLVVDDEATVRSTVRRILEHGGCSVVEAAGAREAESLPDAAMAGIDVALVDLSMPDGNGRDVAHALRARRPDIGIVLMSGFDREEVLRGDLPEGVGFVAKPFRPSDLLSTVRRQR